MFKPPVAEMAFTLESVADFGTAMDAGAFGDLTSDLLGAILEEAGRFASDEIAPLAAGGDQQGAQFSAGAVRMPDGWRDLYARWSADGWNALGGPVDQGGQGLPMALSAAVFEIWNGASMAFGLAPTLTVGAVEAIHSHGSDALRATYLPKLVSGEWTGTMNLTEPQAGSDLSALRTRAERRNDGTYRIFGQKIYITFGEHDLTENIIHLVLARLPDAPPGVKGISLFLVPKVLVSADGTLGARNDVACHSIERKLGIHASPTCTMLFGDGTGETGEAGAVGWLVGEENRGLACMFTMMNAARLLVGVQGVGVAEAAYQKARAYAAERRQGRSTLLVRQPERSGEMAAIIEHPDVAKTLLRMKALTGAARAITYCCGFAIDRAKAERREGASRHWGERASLLTPLAKSFASDVGVEVASLGIQVHGGMGYVEETGAARLLRDARIAPIYEGTNGIQAVDLVVRKLPLSDGRAVRLYLAELADIVGAVAASNRPDFGETAARLDAAIADLTAATDFLLDRLGAKDTDAALAGATAYLRLFALVAGSSYLAKAALADPSREDRTVLARFMAESVLTEVAGLKADVVAGGGSLRDAHTVFAAA